VPPELELLELELELLELELELLELEDELELLLDEELEELLLEELELLEELDDELELLLELSLPGPVQLGRLKLPSWLPWMPNVALWPLDRLPFQLQQLLTVTVEVLPPEITTFQPPVTLAGSSKFNWISQPLIEPGPLLVTVTSS
jgi:hypothetical protein